MRRWISVYWCGWLALAGCAAAVISLLTGARPDRWELYVWVVSLAIWAANWMLATQTGRTWKRLLDAERQKSRSVWS